MLMRKRTGLWIGALGLLVSAALLAACGGGYDSEQPAAAAQQTAEAQQAEQVEQVESAQPEARVQVIRDRAYLGSEDAPVVIQEYSDFL